jgi:hypothetical protein
MAPTVVGFETAPNPFERDDRDSSPAEGRIRTKSMTNKIQKYDEKGSIPFPF